MIDKKKKYEEPELEVFAFVNEDIICLSGDEFDPENEDGENWNGNN